MLTDCRRLPLLQVSVKVVRLVMVCVRVPESKVESVVPVALEVSAQEVSPILLLQVSVVWPPRCTRLGVAVSESPVWTMSLMQVLPLCTWPLGQAHSG